MVIFVVVVVVLVVVWDIVIVGIICSSICPMILLLSSAIFCFPIAQIFCVPTSLLFGKGVSWLDIPAVVFTPFIPVLIFVLVLSFIFTRIIVVVVRSSIGCRCLVL